MDPLTRQIRERRERWVESGGFKFKIRRPTEYELTKWEREGKVTLGIDLVMTHIVDWEGVRECDILGSAGSDQLVAFSVATYREWMEDRPDLWGQVVKAIREDLAANEARIQELAKK